MNQENNNLVKIKASELLNKCKSKEDMKNLSREMGQIIFIMLQAIISLHYPALMGNFLFPF